MLVQHNMNLCINATILTWARERNGFSIEELAEKLGISPHEIEMWEEEIEVPSYTRLEDIADCLKMPIAVFFFPEPPNLDDPKKKFRRLPDYEFARLSSDTLQTIHLAQAYQDSLAELSFGAFPEKQIFHELGSQSLTPRELARKAREYLGITIQQQFKIKSPEKSFKVWRHALEEVGVFTFKDSLKDRFISGFCLLDDRFPVIMVNNSNSFARQVFTIAHELGHILFGVNGVTDVDETYIEFMDADDRSLEIKCNKFAAELLVPHEEFQKDIPDFRASGAAIIPSLALKYSVSREVILRKLLDQNLVSSDEYETMSTQWNKDYLRSRNEKRKGGNSYLTRLSYLGEGFTHLAFENYHEGRLTKMQVATHLNMNSRHIDKLEGYLRW
jgi:Zn-dependent peptidase ImmA (M78 family)/transcriptional regulator with XRE-family HTH domain